MSFRKCEKLSARMIEKAVVSATRRRSPLCADRLMVMYSLLRSRRRPPGQHNPNPAPVGSMLSAFAPWLPYVPAGLGREHGWAGIYHVSLSHLLPASVPAANLQQNLSLRL
jgi:hypothetical protein